MSCNKGEVPSHHVKQEYCETRPKYRRGKRKTAVRVFTINAESKYLIISGVPCTGLESDLVKLFASHGNLQQCKELKDYPKEEFTQVYLIQYHHIQSAKSAKRKLDEHYFFGGMLHICYAPEYETVEDTREKITHRRHSVTSRVKFLQKEDRQQNKKKETRKLAKIAKKKVNKSVQLPEKEKVALLNLNGAQVNLSKPPIPTLPPNFVNSIPLNSNGIPLSLPPPPLPDKPFNAFSLRNERQKFLRPPLSNPKILEKETKACDLSSCSVNTKPKLKPKSGYFYEKVLHELKIKPDIFKASTLPVEKPHNQNKMNKLFIKPPPFLPRTQELKQLDEINSVETTRDGKIPLLGSYIHESTSSEK